jgi:hypothetical protein
MSLKRAVLLAITLLVVVGAGGLIAWWQISSAAPRTGPVPTATVTPKPTVMAEANVQLLERDINSPDLTQQSLALVSELRDGFIADGQPMLPKGVSVTIKPDTLLIDEGGETAWIEATTSDDHTFKLRLVLEDGTWLILYTEEVSG